MNLTLNLDICGFPEELPTKTATFIVVENHRIYGEQPQKPLDHWSVYREAICMAKTIISNQFDVKCKLHLSCVPFNSIQVPVDFPLLPFSTIGNLPSSILF